jgi:prephenate dehydratase
MQATQAQAQQIPLSGQIAKELRYGETTALGLPSSKQLRNFQAQNQSVFTPTNNVIRIPVSSTDFLDLSEAKLALDFTNTGIAASIDGGAGGLISMLRVLSSQDVELERIEGYGLLQCVVNQYSMTEAEYRSEAATMGWGDGSFETLVYLNIAIALT